MIRVTRLGYPRSAGRRPEPLQDVLTDFLTAMENHGHHIISASVIPDPNSAERYEVYVMSRVIDEKAHT